MPIPKIAAGLALAKAKAVVGSIPRSVWIALAVLAILGLGTCAHKKAVKKHYAEAYAAGKADEAARIEKKAKAIAARAAEITGKIKEQNNVESRRIAGVADVIRLRGPGKAACPNSAPTGTSGRVAPVGQAGATVDPMPDREGVELIGLPFAPTVRLAEQHDLCVAEAKAWRDQHRLLVEDYEKQR